MDIAAVHGFGCLALLALGTAIALRPKTRAAGHPRLGRAYATAMLPLLGLALVVGAEDPAVSVFEVITVPLMAGVAAGWWAGTPAGRRRLGAAWVQFHAGGLGGSLIGLYSAATIQLVGRATGDDGSPLLLLSFLPTIVGSPLIARAIARRAPRRAAPAASTA